MGPPLRRRGLLYDPQRHHRRSIRYPGYDYSSRGVYFVTICVHDRAPLLGGVDARAVARSAAGDMVSLWWRKLEDRFPDVELDAWIVMPDHVHGIIILHDVSVARAGKRKTLSRMVQWFKTMTTNAYIRGVDEKRWEPFSGRLWQRNFFERIVRNEAELNAIRQYIEENPRRWEEASGPL